MSHPTHFTPAEDAPPALESIVLDPIADSRWLEAVSEYLEGAEVTLDDPACTRENYSFYEDSR
jgi:hypothetical protein